MEGKVIQIVTWDNDVLVALTDQGVVYLGYDRHEYDKDRKLLSKWAWTKLSLDVEDT